MTLEHPTAHEGAHLVILHHGLWGNVDNLCFIAEQFKQRLGDRLLVYRAQANESELTYDGVDICAERLVREIYSVVIEIENGRDIEDMKGQKLDNHNRMDKVMAPSDNLEARAGATTKKVNQFSFIGYSLGGLIGRFAMGMLDLQGFFDPLDQGGRGIAPMYFVTMASPHLGIREPSPSKLATSYNYLVTHLLSRTGKQLQLVDDYIGGKPLLLIMSEPSSVFMHALARFMRRGIYCNIRNDHTVPFWTAGFSDTDPFDDLDSMEISRYSSLIETFENCDPEYIARRRHERGEALKAAPFKERMSQRWKAIPWTKYAFIGIAVPLLPLWALLVTSTICIQGLNSRRRTKPIVESNKELQQMKDKAMVTGVTAILRSLSEPLSTDETTQGQQQMHWKREESRQGQLHEDPVIQPIVHTIPQDTWVESSVTLAMPPEASPSTIQDSKPTLSLYPQLSQTQRYTLLPIQIEMSRNLNQLDWRKNIIHIEALNAHASIVVREKGSTNHGGVAAVHHLVDMFKEDTESD
ncbi:putative serine esterase-domain-containing protein [Mortierella sp. GBAus27b]|nr:putative serine esterase-domain-containing protein [Mortierella sp. GBAus27b]